MPQTYAYAYTMSLKSAHSHLQSLLYIRYLAIVRLNCNSNIDFGNDIVRRENSPPIYILMVDICIRMPCMSSFGLRTSRMQHKLTFAIIMIPL